MGKAENKIMRRRLLNAYLSSVISISLVLLLVGVASMLLVNAKSVSDYFKENLNVKLELSFLKRCSMNVNYNFDYYRNFNGLVADQQNHLLNVLLGVAFGRNNCCFLGLSGYDLLASNERISSSMKSDYVLNKWTDIPSRNIMLNFSYKFNRKGKK